MKEVLTGENEVDRDGHLGDKKAGDEVVIKGENTGPKERILVVGEQEQHA